MEILIGLIPFAVFALIWFGLKRFTKLTHDEIFFGLAIGLASVAVIGGILVMAYLIGGAILNGFAIA